MPLREWSQFGKCRPVSHLLHSRAARFRLLFLFLDEGPAFYGATRISPERRKQNIPQWQSKHFVASGVLIREPRSPKGESQVRKIDAAFRQVVFEVLCSTTTALVQILE